MKTLAEPPQAAAAPWLTRTLWGLEIALLVLLAPSPWMHPLTAPLLCASLLLVHQFRAALRAGRLADRAFVLCFNVGALGCMVYANAGYILFTTLPQFGDHTDSMWLSIGMACAAMIGGLIIEPLLGRRTSGSALSERYKQALSGWEALAVTGLLYFFSTTLLFITAGDTRWNPEETSDASTFAMGTGRMADLLFFVLGYQLRPKLLQPRNLALIAAGVALALGNGLIRGYREPALLSLLTFGFGAFIRAQSAPALRRQLLFMGLALIPVVVIYMQAIGMARTRFADKGLGERLSLTTQEIGESSSEEGAEDYSIFARLFEPAGQDVIARLQGNGHYAGFEHFERLLYVMVPRFLAPEKESPNVGPEILARDFHYYTLTDLYTVPITLVADCFRRGGWTWVLVVGFFTGLCLRLQYNLTRLLARGPLVEATLAATAVKYLRLYPYSVPGLISQLTWYWFKETLMFAAAGLVIILMHAAVERRRPSSRPPRDLRRPDTAPKLTA